MTDRILSQLIKLNIIDSEDEEIYRFGLEGLFLKIIHYSSYLVIAFFSHEVIRFLIFFASFLVLRKSAGGYHAKTKGGCYISSCLTVLCMMICLRLFTNWEYSLQIGSVLVILADVCIFLIAPLGNRNRILDQEELQIFKRRSYGFLILENFLIVLLTLTGQIKYAVPVLLAVGCEGVLLLLEKMRKGSNEVEQKNSERNI